LAISPSIRRLLASRFLLQDKSDFFPFVILTSPGHDGAVGAGMPLAHRLSPLYFICAPYRSKLETSCGFFFSLGKTHLFLLRRTCGPLTGSSSPSSRSPAGGILPHRPDPPPSLRRTWSPLFLQHYLLATLRLPKSRFTRSALIPLLRAAESIDSRFRCLPGTVPYTPSFRFFVAGVCSFVK